MRLSLYAIGKLRKSPELSLIQDYQQRINAISTSIGFKNFEIIEHDTKKELSGQKLKEYEASKLLDNHNDILIALDETGQNINSRSFATMLEKYKDSGHASCRFVIGGADGLDQSVLQKSNIILSLGKLTWPHMLARVMLCEQIYRAMTICSNHPYHRD